MLSTMCCHVTSIALCYLHTYYISCSMSIVLRAQQRYVLIAETPTALCYAAAQAQTYVNIEYTYGISVRICGRICPNVFCMRWDNTQQIQEPVEYLSFLLWDGVMPHTYARVDIANMKARRHALRGWGAVAESAVVVVGWFAKSARKKRARYAEGERTRYPFCKAHARHSQTHTFEIQWRWTRAHDIKCMYVCLHEPHVHIT